MTKDKKREREKKRYSVTSAISAVWLRLLSFRQPAWSCASLHSVSKQSTQRSSPWPPGQELPGQEGAPGSSFAGRTGCSSLRTCRSCRPWSCPWRPGCRQPSTWRTESPATGREEQRAVTAQQRQEEEVFLRSLRRGSYVVTSYVDLVHPVCHRKQELDSELLVRHVDIRDDLTA